VNQITENAVDQELLDNIQACAEEAAGMLAIDMTTATPSSIVEAVDGFVFDWQKGQQAEFHEDDDPALMFGSLWGEQLVAELGWQWSSVIFHEQDDSVAVGVFSPDRAMAVYPFHFVFGCMENNAPVTIMLAFNMLHEDSGVPALPAGGFENVMDHVQHAVPRDS